MRKIIGMGICAIPLLGCAHNQKSPATKPTASDAVAVQTPLDALDKPLADTAFSGTSFDDVIETLRARTHLDIFVNWRALQPSGINRTLPVTCRLTGMTTGAALQHLLDEIASDRVPLGYTLDNGVITISTKDDLSLNTVTRVYDIRAGLTAKDPRERQSQIDSITRRVQGIHPLSWKSAGGKVGAVRELSGQLIVTATPATQARIVDELKDILPPNGSITPLLSSRRD